MSRIKYEQVKKEKKDPDPRKEKTHNSYLYALETSDMEKKNNKRLVALWKTTIK